MTSIYVANLDLRSTEAGIRSAFEVYGAVKSVRLMPGLAFVEMADPAEAERAITSLDTQTSWVLRELQSAA